MTKIYGGRKRNGVCPAHFSVGSKNVARKVLQSLELLKMVEKDPNGWAPFQCSYYYNTVLIYNRTAISLFVFSLEAIVYPLDEASFHLGHLFNSVVGF